MATWEYHVEPDDRGRWTVRRSDLANPLATYPDRTAAFSAARVLAHLNAGGVLIHETGGRVRLTDHRGRELTPDVHQKLRMRT
jgi:hypothetical protein